MHIENLYTYIISVITDDDDGDVDLMEYRLKSIQESIKSYFAQKRLSGSGKKPSRKSAKRTSDKRKRCLQYGKIL